MALRLTWRRCGSGAAIVAAIAIALVGVGLRARDDAAPATPRVALPSGEQPRAGVPPKLEIVPSPVVTARVLADGKPAADIAVSISDGSRPVLATAWTDRDGLVKFDELPRGPYELWAAGDARASRVIRIEDAATVELPLEPAANVRGQVNADGFVPATSTVTLIPLDGDHATRIALVDDAGRFAIDGVPHGRWRVESDLPGHVQAEQQLKIEGPEATVVVRAVRAGAVRGTVVDSLGAPVPYATIVLRDQTGGFPERPLALASTGLRWVHPLAATRMMPANESGRFGWARPGARPTECGRGHCGIDIGNTRGTVVHAAADGEIASIFAESRTEAGRVVAIHHGGGLKTFYMHLDEVRPGLEVGQAIHAGDPVGLLGSTGFARGAAVPHVHFAITQEYRERTWYIDPEPVLRHAVVLPAPHAYDAVEGASPPTEPLRGVPVVRRLVTDSHGVFQLAEVSPGSYVAGAFASDYAPGVSAPFVIRSGEATNDIAIKLETGLAVRGVVAGRDGPLADAVVTAGAGFGETAHKIATTRTDRTGKFTLRALAGKVTLTVQAPSYGETERALVVDENTREQMFELTIETSRLRGQVLAPDGGAAAGVTVRVIDGPSRRRTVTDAQGRWALDRVATGTYVLELGSADYPAKRIELETEKWREVRLDAGGGARAIVRDAASGAPLANARLELTGPSGQSATRTTNPGGLAELRGLVPGEWKLAARMPGFSAASKTLTIRAERVLQEVMLELPRSATIAGTVRDRYGRRVAGVKVTLGTASTRTDAEGNFRIADAPVGQGTIEATLDDARGALAVELTPGAERVALTIELQ